MNGKYIVPTPRAVTVAATATPTSLDPIVTPPRAGGILDGITVRRNAVVEYCVLLVLCKEFATNQTLRGIYFSTTKTIGTSLQLALIKKEHITRDTLSLLVLSSVQWWMDREDKQ
jgi:hypothetical protein